MRGLEGDLLVDCQSRPPFLSLLPQVQEDNRVVSKRTDHRRAKEPMAGIAM